MQVNKGVKNPHSSTKKQLEALYALMHVLFPLRYIVQLCSSKSIQHFGPEQHIQATVSQISINFGLNIHDPKRMIHNDFVDLT